jgi:hypothetical protein
MYRLIMMLIISRLRVETVSFSVRRGFIGAADGRYLHNSAEGLPADPDILRQLMSHQRLRQ